MLKTIVFIHTLHKILIKESQKIHNCIPYRLELKNWTPVENKEQADTNQNKLKNLDEKLYPRPGCLQDYWETKEINPRGVRDRMRSKMT